MIRKSNTTYNKYERTLWFSLQLMKFLFILCVVINLALPVYLPSTLGYKTWQAYIFISVHIYGLKEGLGYGSQNVPALAYILFRLANVVLHVFVLSSAINWLFYTIVCIMDLVFITYLSLHRSRYEYIKE